MGLVLGKKSKYGQEFEETLQSIQSKQDRFLEQGIEPPEKKEGKGVLTRVFDLLRMGETAPAVMAVLKKESPVSAYSKTFVTPFESEKKEPAAIYSDVLEELGWHADTTPEKFIRGAVGLGLDIFLDPKTYLSLGAFGATKIATKMGIISLNKVGKKVLKKSIKQFGEESGRKMVSDMVTKNPGKYAEKMGLKFMGKEIIPRNVVNAPFRGVDSILEKIPIEGKLYKAFKAWGVNAFSPWKKLHKIPGGMGIEYHDMVNALYKGTRAQQKVAINKWIDYARRAKKEVTSIGDLGSELTGFLEKSGNLTGNKFIDELTGLMTKANKTFIQLEKKAGYTMGELDNYIRHWITKDGSKYISEMGTTNSIVKAIAEISKKSPDFAKKRGLLAAIKDINEMLAPEMTRLGLKGKFFEENAFKLMAIREVEHIKAIKTANFFKEVSERFALKPESLFPKTIAEMIGEQAVWKDGVKYVDAGTSIPILKGKFVPEQIRNHLKEFHAVMTGADEPASQFLKVYDKALSWWKMSVTGWFPAFHSRNLIGATWNNFLRGLKDPKYYKWTQDIISNPGGNTTLFGKVWNNKNLLKKMDEAGIYGQIGMMDFTRTIDDMMADITASGKLNQIKKILSKPPTWAMEQIENRVRIPLMLYRLDKGDSITEAAKVVFATHFDYMPEGLSHFEKTVMKRIIPFYTWTRNNVPFQFEMLAKQPGKFAGMDKLRRSIDGVSGTDKITEERKYMPDWLNDMFTIRLPWVKASGEPYYLQMDLPLEDLNKLSLREITSLLSPLLKYPIESIANKNIYFDSPVYNKNLPREYQTSRVVEIMKHLPEPVKKYLNIQEMEIKNFYTGEFEPSVVMDSRKLHFIRSLFFSRVFSSLSTMFDPKKNREEIISQLLLGEPLRPLDVNELKWSKLKEQDVYLRDTLYYLMRGNIIPYASEEKKKKGLVL